MKIGDVVVFARGSDGATFLGRVMRVRAGRDGLLLGAVDARGVVWWRCVGELQAVGAEDPRLPAFLAASPAPEASGEPADLASAARRRGRPPRPLSDRICDALASGFETSPAIARHLGALPNSVSERMNWLALNGRVERFGYALRGANSPPTLRWRLKARAVAS